MPSHDLFIFDFDGTLADSRAWFTANLNKVAARFDFRQVDATELEALRTATTREIISALQVPLWKLPFIARHMRELAVRDAAEITLFSGVESALSELKRQGALLAIVSSNSEAHVRSTLGDKLSTTISFYSCHAALFGKAAKLRHVLKLSRARPERTIFIGDETRDIEAAHVVGIRSAAVLWGYAAPAALRRMRPSWTLEQPDEIACLLDLAS